MKQITFKAFDRHGELIGHFQADGRYTVRGAMAELESRGFRPICESSRKLHRVWYAETPNGASVNAYII